MSNAEKIRRANVEVHAREAAVYDGIHPEIFGLYEQHKISRDLDFIASIMPKDSVIRALDIGCGTGNLALKYLERGYKVKAVDISPEMLSILKSKLGSTALNRLELVVSDAEAVLVDAHT